MTCDSAYRELIGGHWTPWWGAAARGVLSSTAIVYGEIVARRNRNFDAGRGVRRVPAPVISVGNLNVGGTGKSPMVAWLARRLADQGRRVAIISRGYGSQGGPNDEARELARHLPDVPHLQDRDRHAAALRAIEQYAAQVIVLDDGFQHRRLHRDLDLVLLDALEPFGFGRLLPRGLLREPVASLARADAVALSRADAVPEESRRRIQQQVRAAAPAALWLETVHQPRSLVELDGRERALDAASDTRWLAFCGIGNPDGFQHTLRTLNFHVVRLEQFTDHHRYTAADLNRLHDLARRQNANAIVCTEKDLVKIRPEWLARTGAAARGGPPMPVLALRIGLEIRLGEPALQRLLDERLERCGNG